MNGYNPNRDAYQAINGYVYQVDLSIDSWIDLKDDEFLLLEHLEDIDIIKEYYNINENINNELTVKQVKHLEGVKLTLRRDEIKEAIFNFDIHKGNHSNIKMRILSNAEIGKEDRTNFGLHSIRDRVGGLCIWQEIHKRNEKNVIDLDDTVTTIRNILFETPPEKKKSGKPNLEWINFQNKISKNTNDEFTKDVIKRIEINEGQTSSKTLKSKLIEKLNNKKLASTDSEAEILYNRLFATIFHLISVKDASKESHRKIFSKDRLSELAKESSDEITEIGNLKIREKLDDLLKDITEKIDENTSLLKTTNERIQNIQLIYENEVQQLLNKYKNTPDEITEIEIIKGLCSNNLMLKKYSSAYVYSNDLSEKYQYLINDNLKMYGTDEDLVILSLQALRVVNNIEFEFIEKYANSENKKIKASAFSTLFHFATKIINQDNINTWLYWLEHEESPYIRNNVSYYLRSLSDNGNFNPTELVGRFSLILEKETDALVVEHILAMLKEIPNITKVVNLEEYLSLKYDELIRHQCLYAFYFDENYKIVLDYVENAYIRIVESEDYFEFPDGEIIILYSFCKHSENAELLSFADKIASKYSTIFSQLEEKRKRIIYKKNAITVGKRHPELLQKASFFNKMLDFGATRKNCFFIIYNENSIITKNELINYLVSKGFEKLDLRNVLSTAMRKYEIDFKNKNKLLILLSDEINDKIRNFINMSAKYSIVNFSSSYSSSDNHVSMSNKDFIFIINKKDLENSINFKHLIDKHLKLEFNNELFEI